MTLLTRETCQMRRVRAARYELFMGVEVCVSEDEIHDFQRTTWRLCGVPVWRWDGKKTRVPLHVFIRDCLS